MTNPTPNTIATYEPNGRFDDWTRQLEAQRAAEEQEAYDMEAQYQREIQRRQDDLEWYRQLGKSRVAKLSQRLSVCRDVTQYADMAADQAAILSLLERIEVAS